MPETPGYIDKMGSGYECSECGDEIQEDEKCIRANYGEVDDEGFHPTNYAGIYHTECFKND